MMRVFVAVEVTDSAVIESISVFQSQAGIDARAVEPQNLHFTIQFLGEIQKDAVPRILQELETVNFPKFVVDFRGTGAFPSTKSPRVIWVGTGRAAGERLCLLAEDVGGVLEKLGFSGNAQFVPHVTVFRAKKAGNVGGVLEKYKSAEFGEQEVSSVRLKESVLTPRGPVYSDLGGVSAA